jgi:hypothetical protein
VAKYDTNIINFKIQYITKKSFQLLLGAVGKIIFTSYSFRSRFCAAVVAEAAVEAVVVAAAAAEAVVVERETSEGLE